MPLQIVEVVRGEGVGHLQAYFEPGRYTGQWFETFAGRGDRAETRDRITVEDLYAVEALNVKVPFRVGRELLDGQLGDDISGHLREIPVDADLGTDGAAELVADDSRASQAWQLLRTRGDRNETTGVGWVIAGKLLARKRPKLIPIYDSIVSCQFGAPKRVWLKLHDRLAANNCELRSALTDVRATAGVEDEVSVLRVLDVVLWMRHVKEHRRDKCPHRGCLQL